MKPDDFIVVAKDLSAGSNEAHWRSAVSRAYYGAFHAALQLLVSFGVAFPKTSSAHDKVSQCLQNCKSGALEEARRILASLRDKRNVADYRLDDKRLSVREAIDFELGRTDEVLAVIQSARQNPGAVRKSIRSYARSILGLVVEGND